MGRVAVTELVMLKRGILRYRGFTLRIERLNDEAGEFVSMSCSFLASKMMTSTSRPLTEYIDFSRFQWEVYNF